MNGLDGKVAVVTGAARGIGKAIALRLASEGVAIVGCDLDPETLRNDGFVKNPQSVRKVADEIRDKGGKAIPVYGDITSERDVNNVVSTALVKFNRIDILCNNAGVVLTKLIHEMDLDEWERVLRVNTTGAFIFCKAVMKHLMEQKCGSIINIASIAGKTGSPLFGAYCASKAAMIQFTNVLAKEVAPYDVRANCVCPGMVDTEMWKKLNQELEKEVSLSPGQTPMDKFLEATPISKPEQPEDIAGLVAFLASDDALFITGQAINVDGGYENH